MFGYLSRQRGGLFPDGFVGFFADFLDRPDYQKIVLCAYDRPVAVGGIGWTPFLISRCAWLIFGVVWLSAVGVFMVVGPADWIMTFLGNVE
jgi:hypothetical protein